jgi:hypothetical protein
MVNHRGSRKAHHPFVTFVADTILGRLVEKEWKWLAKIPRIARVPKAAPPIRYCIVVQEFFQARVKRGLRQGKSVFNIEHY